MLPLMFLIDVSFLFASLFVSCCETWWIVWSFQIFVTLYALFVVGYAYRCQQLVPASIPFQRAIGCFFYLSCHMVQFFGPAEIPLSLVAYLLFAGPISLIFLFDSNG